MKTGISLPDALYRQAPQTFLREHDDALITTKLNDVYDEVFGGGSDRPKLDPVLGRIQTLSLVDNQPREEW